MPAVSVIIPTHSPHCIERTMDALAQQSLRDFEVIIVENGMQSDRVRNIPRQYCGAFSVRYYFNYQIGLNRARNYGMRHCFSQVVSLLDDDCIPEKNWISAIRNAHNQFPKAGVIGGRVLLSFDHSQPDWLVDHFRRQLSELDLGPKERVLKNEYLVGANLSFRRSVYDEVGGFDENIGMVGRDGPQLCNDELDFIQRARKLGNPGAVYDGRICVKHTITKRRTNITYFKQRAFGQGVSDVVLHEHASLASSRPQQLLMEKLYHQTGHWDRLNQVLAGLPSHARETYRHNYARCRLAYLAGIVNRIDSKRGSPESSPSTRGPWENGFQAILRLYRRSGMYIGYELIARRLQRLSVGRAGSAASLGGYEAARERVLYLAGMHNAIEGLNRINQPDSFARPQKMEANVGDPLSYRNFRCDS